MSKTCTTRVAVSRHELQITQRALAECTVRHERKAATVHKAAQAEVAQLKSAGDAAAQEVTDTFITSNYVICTVLSCSALALCQLLHGVTIHTTACIR
jgi:hypothetical protein